MPASLLGDGLNSAVLSGNVPRLDVTEIHDQEWFPGLLRKAVTDILQFLLNRVGYLHTVAGLLRAALNKAKTNRVVDLCAGSGGPWPHLAGLVEGEAPLSIYLTDKYPNADKVELRPRASQSKIEVVTESIDAERVPCGLPGFRTMFNSFHHFDPEHAQRVLRSAVERQEGVAVFELPHRSMLMICSAVFMGIGTLLYLPWIRPFHLSLFFWTYVIPVLPIVMWLDGMLSCLRAYTPDELLELAEASSIRPYEWECGVVKGAMWPIRITYLIGLPQTASYNGPPPYTLSVTVYGHPPIDSVASGRHAG